MENNCRIKSLIIESKFSEKYTIEGNRAWFIAFGKVLALIKKGEDEVYENAPADLQGYFDEHVAIAREVKPFLSKYLSSEIDLYSQFRKSPKYGNCMTITQLVTDDAIIPCEHRAFRTHGGNKLEHTAGCWIFTNNLNINFELSEKDFIAQNTLIATKNYHQLLLKYGIEENVFRGKKEVLV